MDLSTGIDSYSANWSDWSLSFERCPIIQPSLWEIHDPPTILYVWGKIEPRDNHAIGVVGSRRTSHYGLECAKKILIRSPMPASLSSAVWPVGIDTASHQGALAAKGRTVAVLGTGLHSFVSRREPCPRRKNCLHRRSGHRISNGYDPDRQTFPMRNRIISGWGFGLLVVEAGVNSGALISASQAADQGRNLYAIPGPIDRPTSHGANRLIQQGAKLVMSVDDILEDVQTLFPRAPELLPSKPPDIEGDLLDGLRGRLPREKHPSTKSSPVPVSGAGPRPSPCFNLEMRHLVKQLPGKYFVKLL